MKKFIIIMPIILILIMVSQAGDYHHDYSLPPGQSKLVSSIWSIYIHASRPNITPQSLPYCGYYDEQWKCGDCVNFFILYASTTPATAIALFNGNYGHIVYYSRGSVYNGHMTYPLSYFLSAVAPLYNMNTGYMIVFYSDTFDVMHSFPVTPSRNTLIATIIYDEKTTMLTARGLYNYTINNTTIYPNAVIAPHSASRIQSLPCSLELPIAPIKWSGKYNYIIIDCTEHTITSYKSNTFTSGDVLTVIVNYLH